MTKSDVSEQKLIKKGTFNLDISEEKLISLPGIVKARNMKSMPLHSHENERIKDLRVGGWDF